MASNQKGSAAGSEKGRGHKYPEPALCTFLPFDVYPILVLTALCSITWGNYWVYDTPGAIQTQLEAWFGGPEQYTKSMNLNLYSVYSYPNIILAFFGGFLIDRVLGIRASALIFCTLIFLGQLVFAVGVQMREYWMCLLGRFIFGLGGENLAVSQNAYTARWFEGPLLSLAFSIVLMFSRLGSSVNFIVTPMLADKGVPPSIWVGVAMCLFSVAACVALTILDYKGQKRVKMEVVEEKVELSHVLRFPLATWLIFFICFTFYIGILTFYAVASDIMQKTGKHYSPGEASFYLAIPNFTSMFAFPIVGYLVDKYGRSLYWCAFASSMLIVAHVIFLGNANEWWFVNPIIMMVWLGTAYAAGASALWPMVSFILPHHVLGTAYGTMTAIQNLGTSLAPQLIGYLQEKPGIKGTPLVYTIPIMLFVVCAATALALSLVLIVVDRTQTDGRLNSSSAERARMEVPKFMKLEESELAEVADLDLKRTLSLPPMMVGTIYLKKTTDRMRSEYFRNLGIGNNSTSPLLQNERSPSRYSQSYESPSHIRSPYRYGNVD